MFLDDDDRWTTHKVKNQLRLASTDSQIGLMYSSRGVVTRDAPEQVKYVLHAKDNGDLFPRILLRNLIGTTSSVALRRSLFDAAGGFDESLPALQDWDLWVRCCRTTCVGADAEIGVLYLDSGIAQHQISTNVEVLAKAMELWMRKYADDYDRLGPLAKRKVESELLAHVARAARTRGMRHALPYMVRSLLKYPTTRSLKGFLPGRTAQALRTFSSRWSGDA